MTEYTLRLTKNEFDAAHSAAVEIRKQVFEKWKVAQAPGQKDFYKQRTDFFDALLLKFTAALIADTSQDAEPDEERDEEDRAEP